MLVRAPGAGALGVARPVALDRADAQAQVVDHARVLFVEDVRVAAALAEEALRLAQALDVATARDRREQVAGLDHRVEPAPERTVDGRAARRRAQAGEAIADAAEVGAVLAPDLAGRLGDRERMAAAGGLHQDADPLHPRLSVVGRLAERVPQIDEVGRDGARGRAGHRPDRHSGSPPRWLARS